jgi:N6-L-threonylcarbamoyladenine synthase
MQLKTKKVKTKQIKVFVIDSKGIPCLSTSSARARRLLKAEKAKVYSVLPFTIQLKYEIKDPVGSFKLGIDDGAKFVGLAVSYKKDIVFQGVVQLRNDVSRKMKQRASYRKTRRNRKLGHRKARFLNRTRPKGWLPPSLLCKKETTLRVIDDLRKRINISICVVEQGQFDTSSLSRGQRLSGTEYQESQYEGNNWRQKVLWRDKYKCRKCKAKDNLQTHHLKPRSQGGTNVVKNGVTLCTDCHTSLHKNNWVFKGRIPHFKYPTQLQQGKWFLWRELKKRFRKVKVIHGWRTAQLRRLLDLEKTHENDAAAITIANNPRCRVLHIKPLRAKAVRDTESKKRLEQEGFKHYDVVKSYKKKAGNFRGMVTSLREKYMFILTQAGKKSYASYKNSQILYEPRGLVYY